MNITIVTASTSSALRAAACIREQVFGERYSNRLPRLDAYAPSKILTLIAREAATNVPVATLSVVDTSGNSKLHRAIGLDVPDRAQAARYTQMAVLKPYRGLQIGSQLITEARFRFIRPREIDYSWLLFPAETANTSFLCATMGFVASTRVTPSEYGPVRLLVRNEITASDDAGWPERAEMHPFARPRAVSENEWLSQ